MTDSDGDQSEDREHGGAGGTRNRRVCICIATCRRPDGLRATLLSLAQLELSARRQDLIEIAIVENDESRASEPIVESLRSGFPWPIQYATEPRAGISFARNRLVEMAGRSDLIAFIDDDEIATPNWLEALLATQDATSADAVLGPVLPRFDASPPDWLAPFFERARPEDQAQVDARHFRTGNLLITTQALQGIEGPFDHAFALTGGSDGFLGRMLEARGARFFWCDAAIVHESVPEDRANLPWLLRRRFRTGVALSMVRIRMEGGFGGRLHGLFKGAGAALLGCLSTLKGLVSGRHGLIEGLALAAFGVGSLYGVFGGRFREYHALHETSSRPDSV